MVVFFSLERIKGRRALASQPVVEARRGEPRGVREVVACDRRSVGGWQRDTADGSSLLGAVQDFRFKISRRGQIWRECCDFRPHDWLVWIIFLEFYWLKSQPIVGLHF
jgi:hypothetical protein